MQELLDHLARYRTELRAAVDTVPVERRAQRPTPETERTPVVPTLDMAFLLDRRNRIVASEAARRRGGADAHASWVALEQSRERLQAVLLGADGLALGDVITPHPALGELKRNRGIGMRGGRCIRRGGSIRGIAIVAADSGWITRGWGRRWRRGCEVLFISTRRECQG